jgi:hypothetical protein
VSFVDRAGGGGLGRCDVFLAPLSEFLETALRPESLDLVLSSAVCSSGVGRLVDGWTGLEMVNERVDLVSNTAAKAWARGNRWWSIPIFDLWPGKSAVYGPFRF